MAHSYTVLFYVKRNGKRLYYTFHALYCANAKDACYIAKTAWAFDGHDDHMYDLHAVRLREYDKSFLNVVNVYGTKFSGMSVLYNFILVDVKPA